VNALYTGEDTTAPTDLHNFVVDESCIAKVVLVQFLDKLINKDIMNYIRCLTLPSIRFGYVAPIVHISLLLYLTSLTILV
jgi:hypothetical protein